MNCRRVCLKQRSDSDCSTVSSQSSPDTTVETLDAAAKDEVLDFAKAVHKAILQQSGFHGSTDFPNLSERTKAEAAIVVLFFEHMDRVLSIMLGETLPYAMFGVPAAESSEQFSG